MHVGLIVYTVEVNYHSLQTFSLFIFRGLSLASVNLSIRALYRLTIENNAHRNFNSELDLVRADPRLEIFWKIEGDEPTFGTCHKMRTNSGGRGRGFVGKFLKMLHFAKPRMGRRDLRTRFPPPHFKTPLALGEASIPQSRNLQFGKLMDKSWSCARTMT